MSNENGVGKIWLVTRHPGALAWMKLKNIYFDLHVPHLDALSISSGDVVIGSLPVHLAAQVCDRGGCYFNLSLNVPFELRGQELSAETLANCDARLEKFVIHRVELHDEQADDDLQICKDFDVTGIE